KVGLELGRIFFVQSHEVRGGCVTSLHTFARHCKSSAAFLCDGPDPALRASQLCLREKGLSHPLNPISPLWSTGLQPFLYVLLRQARKPLLQEGIDVTGASLAVLKPGNHLEKWDFDFSLFRHHRPNPSQRLEALCIGAERNRC